jgi:hypothetical protein
MFTYAWPTVIQKMTQVLNIYPKVKGILERLRTWNVFSNSSPVEGITRANRANRSTWRPPSTARRSTELGPRKGNSYPAMLAARPLGAEPR